MISNRRIITSLNIRNVMNFMANKKKHVYNELEKIFVSKCYAGGFIISIVEINEISDCNIVKTNNSGEGIINVKFTVEIIVFPHNGIIVGAEIIHNQSMILAIYKYNTIKAIVSIPPSTRHLTSTALTKSIESLAIGQKIPLRIIDANHQPMKEEATIFGTLLVCDKVATIYKLNGTLNASIKVDLIPYLDAIKGELEIRKTMFSDKNINFFEKHLYSYLNESNISNSINSKNYPEWVGPSMIESSNLINLLDFIDKENNSVTGYWSQSLNIYRSSPLIQFTMVEPTSSFIEEESIGSVFIQFLKNMLDFLMAIRQMAELYNSPEMIKAHENIWGAMKAVQLH